MTTTDHILGWINKIASIDMGYGQVITGRLISIRGDELLLQRHNGSRLAINRLEAKLIRSVRKQQA
jgi:hypothetical protein